MKLRTKICTTFGMAAVGLVMLATVAFACIPSHFGGGRACGVCGGIVGTVGYAAPADADAGRSLPGVIAVGALGAAGVALFLGGIVVLARDPRRDPVGVAVRPI